MFRLLDSHCSVMFSSYFISPSVSFDGKMSSTNNREVSFGKALAFPLLVHQIFFLSPIVRDATNLRLLPSKYLTFYSYTWLVVHFGLLFVFIANSPSRSANTINEIGYIWYTLSLLDFVMSKFSFLIIVVLSQRNKLHQLQFLTKTANLDKFLASEFEVHRNYSSMSIGSVVSIGLCFLYAIIATRMNWYKLAGVDVSSFGIRLIYTIPYFLDKLTGTLMTNAYVVCTVIIYVRYCALRRILVKGQHRSFESILKVFSDISELGDLLHQYSSVLLFTRFAHDFMLCTSTTYLLCEIYISGSTCNVNWVPVAALLTTNYARVLMVTITTELAQREVKIT